MARILFINKGGMGGPSHSLLKLLAIVRYQYDVQVITSDNGEFGKALQLAGIKHRFLDVRYRSIPGIFWLLKREKIDLVYANSFTAAAWRVLIAAKLAGCKTIWHLREIMTVDAENSLSVRRRIRLVDQIIAVSAASKQSAQKIAPSTPATVVYNGVNPDDFPTDPSAARSYLSGQLGRQPGDTILVSIGTITQRKNQLDAVRAVRKIILENRRIHLYLLGESHPEYLAKLTGLIESFGLQENIHITGFRPDIPQILSGSDICIHTALVDPHPRAVLEALGAGIAVVAYNVDGVGETLVDGENGFLVPVGDVNRLEQSIRKIISNPDLGKKMGAMGRQTVLSRFSAEQNAANVLRVIEKVLRDEVVN